MKQNIARIRKAVAMKRAEFDTEEFNLRGELEYRKEELEAIKADIAACDDEVEYLSLTDEKADVEKSIKFNELQLSKFMTGLKENEKKAFSDQRKANKAFEELLKVIASANAEIEEIRDIENMAGGNHEYPSFEKTFKAGNPLTLESFIGAYYLNQKMRRDGLDHFGVSLV